MNGPLVEFYGSKIALIFLGFVNRFPTHYDVLDNVLFKTPPYSTRFRISERGMGISPLPQLAFSLYNRDVFIEHTIGIFLETLFQLDR